MAAATTAIPTPHVKNCGSLYIYTSYKNSTMDKKEYNKVTLTPWMYVSRLEQAFQKFLEFYDEKGHLVGNPCYCARQACF